MKTEAEIFYETIGTCLVEKWGLSSTNKLSLTCLYCLNIFSDNDLIYWKIAKLVNDLIKKVKYSKARDKDKDKESINNYKNNLNNENLTKLLVAIYCILASNQTIYGLPSMLDLKWKNGKISPHILFGEALSNLASITLVAEAHKILLELDTSISKIKLIAVLNKQIIDFRTNSDLIKQFGKSTKTMINTDYKIFQNVLLINMIMSILILNGYEINKVTKLKENITRIVKVIVKLLDEINISSITDSMINKLLTDENIFNQLL